MSKEHWHAGPRSDYITALALARSNAETQGHSGSRPKHDRHMPKRLPPSAIPDLRFEPTYLAKLAAAGSGWQSIVYITVRDQVINPLLQGALWCVASRWLGLILSDVPCTGALRPCSYNPCYDP
jgi:hypothetical protein